MRSMDAPSRDPNNVYNSCVNGVGDVYIQARLRDIAASISSSYDDYAVRATSKTLYQITPYALRDHEVVVGEVTKKELTDLYTNQLSKKTKPTRDIYDYILSTAPKGKCPFCGVGFATTLDHYLPKQKYPLYSVLPINLIPCCKDCNTGRGSDIATAIEDQVLHPYFDGNGFVEEQWLFARVIESRPPTIEFYVSAPKHWDEISTKRVLKHFEEFDLSKKYSIEASNQLGSLRDTLNEYWFELGSAGVKKHLEIEARSSFNTHVNSWQTSMFQALSESDWYCNDGFNNG